MAPSIREAAEAASSGPESSLPQTSTRAKAASASLRSDAVSLEVPVKIHGSRSVSRDITAPTQPFEEETSTIIVFPQGGVLRMASGVNVAQMLVLTNLKSRQDAICRVVKVRNFSNTQSYVEVEFTQPQAKFWGVYFPSESGAGRRPSSAFVQRPSAQPTVAPENVGPSSDAANSSAPKPVKAGAHSKEASPARVPSPPPSGKPASVFASIAAQQKTQLQARVSRTEATLS